MGGGSLVDWVYWVGYLPHPITRALEIETPSNLSARREGEGGVQTISNDKY